MKSGDGKPRLRSLEAVQRGPLAQYLEDGPRLDVPSSGALSAGSTGFAVVFADYKLQDISDYRGALQSWFEAVRVGGRLIIAVPHAFLYERQIALPSHRRPEQRRLYTPASLMQEVEEALAPNSYRVRWLGDEDSGYDYALGRDTTPVGGHHILLVLERIASPTWGLIETPEVKALSPDYRFEPEHTRREVVSLAQQRKILILKLDHLGDFIMSIAALEKARGAFPDADITLVVGSWNVEMAESLGLADRVIAFDIYPRNSSEEKVDVLGKTALFEALITEPYDIAIDLRTDADTRFLLKSVRADVRAGMGSRNAFPYLDIFLPVDFTRHEPESARVDELNHHAFASQHYCPRNDYRISFNKETVDPALGAIVWGPYRPLRTGNYIFEPSVEVEEGGKGVLTFDVALDTRWVVHRAVSSPGRVQLAFTVTKENSEFEFRIWAVDGARPLDFNFYGGRLIREGASSVLHQSEYLSLLIELVAMRVARYGLLGEADDR